MQALYYLKSMWEKVAALDLARAVNTEVQKLWSFFYWTEQTYPWEILTRPAEDNFEKVAESVMISLDKVFSSMLTTSLAELAARQVKL